MVNKQIINLYLDVEVYNSSRKKLCLTIHRSQKNFCCPPKIFEADKYVGIRQTVCFSSLSLIAPKKTVISQFLSRKK